MIRALAIALALTTAASAQVGPLPGMAVLGPRNIVGPATLTFTGNGASSTAGATQTVSGVSFGTAGSNRYVICAVAALGGSAFTFSGLTVGGVAATQAVTISNNSSAPSTSAIYIAYVPTGASGNVVATLSTSVTSMGVACYAATNIFNPTATATATSVANTGSAALTINTNGVGLGIGQTETSPSTSPDATWVNLSEDTDALMTSAVNYSSASHVGAQSNTVTVTWGGNSISGRMTMVLAAFR